MSVTLSQQDAEVIRDWIKQGQDAQIMLADHLDGHSLTAQAAKLEAWERDIESREREIHNSAKLSLEANVIRRRKLELSKAEDELREREAQLSERWQAFLSTKLKARKELRRKLTKAGIQHVSKIEEMLASLDEWIDDDIEDGIACDSSVIREWAAEHLAPIIEAYYLSQREARERKGAA